jgi:lipopolysaccharide export system protein LptA
MAAPVVLTAEPDNTIHIQADQLEADIEGDTAEFSGNVRVDRGEAQIKADHLKLYYHRDKNVESLQQIDASAVDKIEARGKVRIRFQDLSAESDKAVYDPKTDTLVLEGRNTRVTRSGNSIKGARIVLKAAENDLTVVGDGKSRVKAVIAPGKGFF